MENPAYDPAYEVRHLVRSFVAVSVCRVSAQICAEDSFRSREKESCAGCLGAVLGAPAVSSSALLGALAAADMKKEDIPPPPPPPASSSSASGLPADEERASMGADADMRPVSERLADATPRVLSTLYQWVSCRFKERRGVALEPAPDGLPPPPTSWVMPRSLVFCTLAVASSTKNDLTLVP